MGYECRVFEAGRCCVRCRLQPTTSDFDGIFFSVGFPRSRGHAGATTREYWKRARMWGEKGGVRRLGRGWIRYDWKDSQRHEDTGRTYPGRWIRGRHEHLYLTASRWSSQQFLGIHINPLACSLLSHMPAHPAPCHSLQTHQRQPSNRCNARACCCV